jgi:hypothetical protein
MAYHVESFRYVPCPCGKGTYTVIREVNDWGKSREYWDMKCPTCKEALRLEAVSDAKDAAGYKWSPRDGKPDAPRPE